MDWITSIVCLATATAVIAVLFWHAVGSERDDDEWFRGAR
jgi:hypothetical protein